MSATEKKILRVTTPAGRLSFPTLFKARLSELSGKEQYEATILIPKAGSDITNLVAAVKAKMEEHWPNAATRPSLAENRGPIKDGDTWIGENGRKKSDQYPEMAGCWVIRASSLNKPPVVNHALLPITDASEVYSGCWIRLGLTVFWYDNKRKGCSFGLVTVQKLKDDSKFGASGNPEDFFDTVPNTDAPAPEAAPKGTDIFS